MPTVLVVDDVPDIRFLVCQVLSLAGYDVEEAGSGPEALRRLAEPNPPDLVILDVQMPDMDGWEALAALRAAPATADLPVILCTVKVGAPDTIRAWELGCDGYVTKPFRTAALVAEVRAVHSRSAAERTTLRTQRLAAAHAASLPGSQQ